MGEVRSVKTTSARASWLEEALRLHNEALLFEAYSPKPARVSTGFSERCLAAAETAVAIARLRSAKPNLGFLPLPISEYLDELSRLAQVDLASTLSAVGLDRHGETSEFSVALARFCRQLGFSMRELALHLGFGLAERLGAPAMPLVLARHHGSRGKYEELSAFEDSLRSALAEVGALEAIKELEGQLRLVYEEPGT